jgi:MFS family permease
MCSQTSSLWRNRDFVLLLSGQTVSRFGSTLSDLAFPLLVLALTGSAVQTGLSLALEALPFLLFSLPAGAWIDRWRRKQVMIFCNLLRAINVASIPFAMAIRHLTVGQLYLTSFVEGVLTVFSNTALVAAIPRIVPKQQLTAAKAADYASDSAAQIIGQPISSFLFFSIGRAVPFLLDAVSYLVIAFSLFGIRGKLEQQRTSPPQHLHQEILEGFLWLWNNPLIRFQTFLGAGLNFTISTTPLIVILLAQHLHALSSSGLIFAIGSVGSIIGSFSASYVQKRFRFGQVIIVSFGVMALLWPLYALALSALFLGLVAFGIFLTEVVCSSVNISYRLALVPDELQGRVNSVYRLFGFGLGRPLGLVIAGILSQQFGVILTVWVFFGVWLLLAVAATLNSHVQNAPVI